MGDEIGIIISKEVLLLQNYCFHLLSCNVVMVEILDKDDDEKVKGTMRTRKGGLCMIIHLFVRSFDCSGYVLGRDHTKMKGYD